MRQKVGYYLFLLLKKEEYYMSLPESYRYLPRLEKLNYIQDQSVNAWIDNGYNGTIVLATGIGKSIVALKAIYKALEHKKIKKKDTIFFLSETGERETTFRLQEFPFFEELTGKDVTKDFDVQFYCYQNKRIPNTAKLAVYDEIQDALTDKYSYVFNLTFPYKLGLTATIPEHVSVFRNRIPAELVNKVKQSANTDLITDFINKGQLLEKQLPIVYEYDIHQAIDDGILSPYKTYIVNHALDNKRSYLPLFKKTPKLSTEAQYYAVRQKMIMDRTKPKFLKGNMARSCVTLLYTLESKIELVNKLVSQLEGKTLISGVHLEPLRKIKDIAVVEGDVTLESIIRNNNQIIGTAKKLKQGATIPGLQNLIMFSYTSSWKDFTQYVGRLTRYEEGKIGKVFIIRTLNTYEMDWVDRIPAIYDKNLKRLPDLNMRLAEDIYGI